MPNYSFVRCDINQYQDFFYLMKDVPSVGKTFIDGNGVVWKRVFCIPQASIDTNLDPYSSKDFNKKFANKKGITIGDTLDESRSLSEKRAGKDGKDALREKHYEKYRKEHRGAEHPYEKKEKFNELQKKLGINLNFDKR